MSHDFLSIGLSKITPAIRNSKLTTDMGKISNDGLRLLMDGYDDVTGNLVHTDGVMNAWIKVPEHAASALSEILSTAIHYTKEEIKAEFKNPNSIWYEGD